MIKRKGKKYVYLSVFALVLTGSFFSFIFFSGFDSKYFTKLSFYLDMANPAVKVVGVQEGLRKEQVASVMAKKLGWTEEAKTDFENLHFILGENNLEGRYFPRTYTVSRWSTPEEVGGIMMEEFDKRLDELEDTTRKKLINRETALKIASIIQREAAGKHDMALISGIIWNRMYSGMKLQMDATLQYAKGSEEEGWWTRVYSDDKYIDSDYNTYKHKGLPPGAISNPGIAAIEAAYNPKKTNCFFYLHDKKGGIHCSRTYEGHKANIEKYY